MQFQFLLPTKIVMEPGLRQRTGEHLIDLGLRHVLLVTDPGVKNAGLLDSIYASLEAAGVRYDEIADVKPNPRSEDVNRAAEHYRGKGIDGVLAVGGGSAMDAAKAISVLLTHEGKVEDYEGAFTLKGPVLPIVAIPTTAGTGSEVTFFSVITDTRRQFKMSLLDYRIGPVLALLSRILMAFAFAMLVPMAVKASMSSSEVDASATTATSAPTAAVSPSGTTILRTMPLTGDSTALVVLVDSTSMTSWPRSIRSPTATSHSASSPSVMVIPHLGMVIASIDIDPTSK